MKDVIKNNIKNLNNKVENLYKYEIYLDSIGEEDEEYMEKTCPTMENVEYSTIDFFHFLEIAKENIIENKFKPTEIADILKDLNYATKSGMKVIHRLREKYGYSMLDTLNEYLFLY